MAKTSISQFVSSHPYVCGAAALTSVGFAVSVYAFRSFLRGGSRVCTSEVRLDGKMVIITGANTGIGKETAIDLARRGARVILACRSVERGEKAAVEVRERSGNENVVFRQLDLSSLASVRQFSAKILEEEPRIDILINNAGRGPAPYSTTVEGYEAIFVTNYLGHFLLTCLLLERLKQAPSARIVNVSADAYKFTEIDFNNVNLERGYSGLKAYARSKLAQVMFTRELARRLKGTKVTVTSLHPGGVQTDILQRGAWPLVRLQGRVHIDEGSSPCSCGLEAYLVAFCH